MIAIRRYTDLSALIYMLVHNEIPILGYGSWDDVNDRKSMSIWQSTLQYGFAGAICLTEAAETFHHWKVFASGPTGVSIIFDKDRLIEAFSGHGLFGSNGHFLWGNMQYVAMNDLKNVDASDIHRLPFIKRVGFRDEREFRVVGYTLDRNVSLMHVPLDQSVIKEVTFSPFMHPTLVQSCKIALRSIDGWSKLKMGHSKLTDNQTWQKGLVDFRERHGVIYGPWMEGQSLEFEE